MTAPVAAGTPAASGPRAAQLQKTARQLEGVFVLQMLKAMRATVPKGGVVDANGGEETFTSMLDEKVAEQVPAQWTHGLTDALLKQLVGRDSAARASNPTINLTAPAPEHLK